MTASLKAHLTLPEVPDYDPPTHLVMVWFFVNDTWNRARAGVANDLAGAKDVIAKDYDAVRRTYGGLIAGGTAPRVYRIYRVLGDGWVQVGEDDLRL